MKTFLTLFFIYSQTSIQGFLQSQSSIIDDQIEREQVQTYRFNLNQEISHSGFKINLKTITTTPEWIDNFDNLSKKYVSKQSQGHLVEISKELYLELENYPSKRIYYYFNYFVVGNFVKGYDDRNYHLFTDFRLVYDQERRLVSGFNNYQRQLFDVKNHNLPGNVDPRIIVANKMFDLTHQNTSYYLKTQVDIGLSLWDMRPYFYFANQQEINWELIFYLNSVVIEIERKVYNFEFLPDHITTIFFNEKLAMKTLVNNYFQKVIKQYLENLESQYLSINFNVKHFWNQANIDAYNDKLIINKFIYELPLKDQKGTEFQHKIVLILVHQKKVQIEFEQLYETDDLDDLLGELKQILTDQGYDQNYFNFQVNLVNSTISISSRNPDFLLFEPTTINFKLVEPEVNHDDEKPIIIEKDLKLQDDLPLKKQAAFNNYFLLLIIPISFLLIYLSLTLWKKYH